MEPGARRETKATETTLRPAGGARREPLEEVAGVPEGPLGARRDGEADEEVGAGELRHGLPVVGRVPLVLGGVVPRRDPLLPALHARRRRAGRVLPADAEEEGRDPLLHERVLVRADELDL